MCSGYVTFHGQNGHTQTLAMSERRNALVAAAGLILEIDRIGAAAEPAGMVSASVIDNWPNNRVNIPHRTELSWAIVHETPEGRAAIVAAIEAAVARIRETSGLEIELAHRHYREPCRFDAGLIEAGLGVAAGLGLSAITMPTLTAHDALSMTGLCPTALIFVPCRGGVSHSEAEWTEPEQAAAGARVLAGLTVISAG